MTQTERELFISLFNRNGYVLDFSTSKFNQFTKESVGLALCEEYLLSKGKSLERFLTEASAELSNKLLLDLLDYYYLSYPYYEKEKDTRYARLYEKCRKIVERTQEDSSYRFLISNSNDSFWTVEYINSQMKIMLENQSENPTESIGKAKELIESCCKTILENSNVEYEKDWSVSTLVDKTMTILEITPEHVSSDALACKDIKAILGNLKGIASNIAKIRNAYGSGHGKAASYKGLQERHAKLAIGSTITLVNFLWDSFKRKNS